MNSRGGGRPRGRLRGDSAEANELAQLLRRLLDERGMTVRQLRDSFTDEQFAPDPVPSHATVSRRLNGEGLANQTKLIIAIITVCVPPSEVAKVLKQAFSLQRKANQAPTPVDDPIGEVDASARQREEISRLRGRLITLQDELAVERRLRAEAEKVSAQSVAAISWLLAGRRTAAPRPVAPVRPLPERRVVTPSTSSPRPPTEPDTELETLLDELRSLDPTGHRFASILRDVWDQQLDGAHTGRYRWDQLLKTEKSFMETLVRRSVLREFRFSSGESLEFQLDGIEFDCKYSLRAGRWVLPREAVGKLCMLIWADDSQTRWGAGIVRVHEHYLSPGLNRDGKSSLNQEGRAAVKWLHRDASLPENVLLRLPEEEVTAIFARRSGQARVEELFRRAQRRLISMACVATVAMQANAAKRIRAARSQLRAEGLIVLGSNARDQRIAHELGLPVPETREWISARISPQDATYDETPFIELGQRRWTLAEPGDTVSPVPELPLPH